MFSGCSSLGSDDLNGLIRNFDTSNVEGMYGMFADCSSATTIDVSNFNTSKVYNLSEMFRGCSSLTSVDVSQWDTRNVEVMYYMFQDCTSLKTIDVSHWQTPNLSDVEAMFDNCTSLTALDLSSFNFENVGYTKDMLNNNINLKTLTVGANDLHQVTETENTFNGVGTVEDPCLLNISDGFDTSILGTPRQGTYTWLAGNFIVPTLALSLNETKDNRSLFFSVDGKTIIVDTKCTFHAGRLNTICYPFDLTKEQMASTFGTDYLLCQLYDARRTDGTLNLYFSKVTDGLKAGTPYLLQVSKDVVDSTFAAVTINAAADNPKTVTYDGGAVTFHGISWPTALTNNDRNTLFVRNDTLYYPSVEDGDCTIYGQRGFFTVSTANAKPMRFTVTIDDDSTTAISTITRTRETLESAYSLTGQRVSSCYKGIVIRHGRKYINR